MKKTALMVIALLMVLMMGTVAFGSVINYQDFEGVGLEEYVVVEIPANDYMTPDLFTIVSIDDVTNEEDEDITDDGDIDDYVIYELTLYCIEEDQYTSLGIFEGETRMYFEGVIDPGMDYEVLMMNMNENFLTGTLYCGID